MYNTYYRQYLLEANSNTFGPVLTVNLKGIIKFKVVSHSTINKQPSKGKHSAINEMMRHTLTI